MTTSLFNKMPSISAPGKSKCHVGWEAIRQEIGKSIESIPARKKIVVIECYHGVDEKILAKELLSKELLAIMKTSHVIHAQEAMHSSNYIRNMVEPFVTDDRIFGYMTDLSVEQFFDPGKVAEISKQIENTASGLIIIYGIGASIIASDYDLLIYADMPRWEIQQRMRNGNTPSLGLFNQDIDPVRLYKQAYFVDWRICDQVKKRLLPVCHFILDTTKPENPIMLDGGTYHHCMAHLVTRPFSVVPFFDPGPWGGQWMKNVCGLDKSVTNYAWCFNCVPEENSILLRFGKTTFETPAINLVFSQPEALLGSEVLDRFGAEFPIRFDFLDTMGGGNLSLQVHPTTSYIREKFGMTYTQDESYYFMDAKEGATSFLGLKEGVDKQTVLSDLRDAQNGKQAFDAKKHIGSWPVKKHDHHLIPAGTIHCQGKDSMVLEISATPYIFTFKLWDWGRVGLDGQPRPINIDHGEQVIQWDRTTLWTKKNLINQVRPIAQTTEWREESTGLHQLEFIETRRHWFTGKVPHDTEGTVHVLNLVEGKEAIVESPRGTFDPFIIHYAETFIVPADVGKYTIRPYGQSQGQKLATIKAYVRN